MGGGTTSSEVPGSAPLAREVLEELRLRIEHQHAAVALAERLAVRLEAAVERVELRIGLVGLRIDRGGLGVAGAARLLRLAVRVGEDHLAVLVGVRADALCGLRAFG